MSSSETHPSGPKAEAAEAFRRGLAHHEAGEAPEAFSAFLMAMALDPGTTAHARMALHYLGLASGYRALPQPVIAALTVCAENPDLDLQPLSLVVKNLLEGDPRFQDFCAIAETGPFESELRMGRFDWLLNDVLVQGTLARALNISLRLEKLLTALRRHACLRLAAGAATALLSRRPYRIFMGALALQCIAGRHAWTVTPEEADALHAIAGRNDAEAAVLRAAYVPLTELSSAAVANLPEALQLRHMSMLREKELAAALPELSPVASGVSAAVAEQYTAFPYPPWEQIATGDARSLGALLRSRHAHLTFPPALDGAIDILSAGCGTGMGAALLAKTVKGGHVTAVDLSRSSLGFAARKAEDLKLGNITFGAADILTLPDAQPDWKNRFHLIESTGVLHHMADPAAGLAALLPLLHPGGVMRLAFYSERGRAAVVAARALVTASGLPHSAEGVRAARQAIIALPADHPAKGVMDSPEFFSLDGLHDLIFNVQEHRYHPRDLKVLLNSAGLAVFGVEPANPERRAQFAARHPAAADAADLDVWDAFEEEFPDTFAEMIQLWCRRQET